MKEAKHTPGPWEIGYGKNGITGYGATCHDWDQEKKTSVVYSSRAESIESKPVILVSAAYCAILPECNTVVAHVIPMPDTMTDTPEVGQANASLIAAAPELDAACREAFVDISALLLATKWELAPEVRSQLESTAKKCESAFLKARGTK